MVGRTGADGFASVALGNLLEAGVDTSWTGAADEDATGCAAVMVDECSGENQIVVGAAANLRASAGAHLRPALEAVAADGGRAVLVMQMEVPLPEVAAQPEGAEQTDAGEPPEAAGQTGVAEVLRARGAVA